MKRWRHVNKTKCLAWGRANMMKVDKSKRVLLGILVLTLGIFSYLWWPSESDLAADKSVVMRGRLLIPVSMAITQPIPSNLVFDARKVEIGRASCRERV